MGGKSKRWAGAAAALLLLLAPLTLAACTAKEEGQPPASPEATATSIPEVPYGVDGLTVGRQDKLSSLLYAMQLSSRDELADMVDEYDLKGEDFNLLSRYDETFFKKNVVIVVLTDAGGGIGFDVTSAHVVGQQLILSMWQTGKLDETKPEIGGLIVSFNREDVADTENAEIHLQAVVQ